MRTVGSSMRGVEFVCGALLLASGVMAPIDDLAGAGPVPPGIAGALARFGEATYAGDATLTTEDAALHVRGALAAQASGPFSVQLYDFRENHHTVFSTGIYGGDFSDGLRLLQYEGSFDDATIRFVGLEDAALLAWSVGAGTRFDLVLAPTARGVIRPTPNAVSGEGPGGGFGYWVDGPSFVIAQGTPPPGVSPAVDLDFKRVEASGQIQIVLAGGAEATVTSKDGDETFQTWTKEGTKVGPGGRPGARTEIAASHRYLVVTLDQAAFGMAFVGLDAFLATRDASWAINGTLGFLATAGRLTSDGGRPLDDDRVDVQGNATLRSKAQGLGDMREQVGWLTTPPVRPLDDPYVEAEMESPDGRVFLNGEELGAAEPRVRATYVEEATFVAKLLGALMVLIGMVRALLVFVPAMVTHDPLRHPRRKAIHRFVADRGMTYAREIQRATGIPLGSLVYHMNVLRRSEVIASVQRAGYRVYFLRSVEFGRDDMRRLALLADPTRRAICEQLARCTPLSQGELAERVGVSQPAVSRQLAALVGDGLAERVSGRRSTYHATALVRRWLVRGDASDAGGDVAESSPGWGPST